MRLDPDQVTSDLFTVRSATDRDIDAMLKVELDAQPAPWTRAVLSRELEVEFSSIWVVEIEGEIGAYFVFWIVRDEVHILNVAVHSDFRRRGIARTVLLEMERQASDERMTVISLEVRASNEAAQKLYSGLGFERIAVRPNYYNDNGEDAWVLTKILEETPLDSD